VFAIHFCVSIAYFRAQLFFIEQRHKENKNNVDEKTFSCGFQLHGVGIGLQRLWMQIEKQQYSSGRIRSRGCAYATTTTTTTSTASSSYPRP
jgi:hypothetical protein